MYVETSDTLVPAHTIKVKTDERVAGKSIFGYLKVTTEPITCKFYGVYGQMMYSMTGIGGYAEKAYVYEDFSPAPPVGYENQKLTNITYAPVSTLSAWTDLQTNGEKWQFGLFAGYTKNLGASETISSTGNYFGRGNDINYIYRISPRAIYTNGKFRIAPEMEYTVAAYATRDEGGNLNIDDKGVVTDSKEIANFRFLIGVYYMF